MVWAAVSSGSQQITKYTIKDLAFLKQVMPARTPRIRQVVNTESF